MKLKIDFATEADDYGQMMDRLNLFIAELKQNVDDGFKEVEQDFLKDDETFYGSFSHDNYYIEIDL